MDGDSGDERNDELTCVRSDESLLSSSNSILGCFKTCFGMERGKYADRRYKTLVCKSASICQHR